MRIAWFTPLSARTGIARYSAAVVEALSAVADVEVWAPWCDDAVVLDGAVTHELADVDAAAAATDGFDLRVFNLGNHPGHLMPLYRAYERAPGLVVMHDRVMQDFFYNGFPPLAYYRLMTYFYGEAGSAAAVRALDDGLLLRDPEFAGAFPLFEACLWNAQGAVAHAAGAAGVMRARYGSLVPVMAAQLPLSAGRRVAPSVSREDLGIPDGRTLLVSTGRVAASKRTADVLEAIAGSARLRESCFFVSVGEAEPDHLAELQSVVAARGLEESVRFVTVADDDRLNAFLGAADICLNLRNPSTETGSATLVEQLDAGKPIVVYDNGVYGELPEGTVAKVALAAGAAGIRDSLLLLLDEPSRRAELGRRAREYARDHCDPVVYANAFVGFASEVIAGRPRLSAIDAAAGLIGSPRDLPALRARASAVAAGLGDPVAGVESAS